MPSLPNSNNKLPGGLGGGVVLKKVFACGEHRTTCSVGESLLSPNFSQERICFVLNKCQFIGRKKKRYNAETEENLCHSKTEKTTFSNLSFTCEIDVFH